MTNMNALTSCMSVNNPNKLVFTAFCIVTKRLPASNYLYR